jgi:hypothetical protein
MLMSPVGNVSTSRAQAVLHTCCVVEGQVGLFDFKLRQTDSPPPLSVFCIIA